MRLHMSSKNELIDVINSARASGNDVKTIRPQKHAPNSVYMTLVHGGRQVGPVQVEGDAGELSRKFAEAQAHLAALKSKPATGRTAAA
jgi:hypothetical protein